MLREGIHGQLRAAIEVSAADRAELERRQRASSTPAGLSRRVRAVLLMTQGLSHGESPSELATPLCR
jgi:hypothetical protein